MSILTSLLLIVQNGLYAGHKKSRFNGYKSNVLCCVPQCIAGVVNLSAPLLSDDSYSYCQSCTEYQFVCCNINSLLHVIFLLLHIIFFFSIIFSEKLGNYRNIEIQCNFFNHIPNKIFISFNSFQMKFFRRPHHPTQNISVCT